jgi:large subunit ribosomal protein L17
MITLAKRGTLSAKGQARAFCLQESVIRKLWESLAQRYKDRAGGYTRIHKFGHRKGDNAPHAILELVDNPRDLRLALTAKAIGWELALRNLSKPGASRSSIDPEHVIRSTFREPQRPSILRQLTALNVRKLLSLGNAEEKLTFLTSEAREWMVGRIAYSQRH